MMLRFASRLAAFPSAGRQAALRALTKPVQLAAAPTIASQVRGHAGQTMQEMLVANMDLPMGAAALLGTCAVGGTCAAACSLENCKDSLEDLRVLGG